VLAELVQARQAQHLAEPLRHPVALELLKA
jgi:hypothetical protein